MACRTDRAAALLLVLLCAACRDDRHAVACEDESGVIVADALPEEPETVRYRELWRSGSSHEDEHLGFPLSAAISADGRAAIVDFQLADLFVVEPDGGWRGSIARRGAGPGELSTPVAAVWDHTGNLLVFDIGRAMILTYGPDLVFAGERRVAPEAVAALVQGGELGWAGVQPSGALLLQPPMADPAADGTSTEVLLRYPPGSAAPDTVAAASFPVVTAANAPVWAVPGWARLSASVGPGGRTVVAGQTAEYRFTVFGGDGDTAMRVCAPLRGASLTPAERGSDPPDRMEPLAAAMAAAPPAPLPAAIGRVVHGADGTIWVQRQRRSPYPDDFSWLHGMPGSVYDVFDEAGRYTRTLALPARARLQGALGDTIWVYEVGDMDDISLAAYRIEDAAD